MNTHFVQEEKPVKRIGIARVYDHAQLLTFLELAGITIERFLSKEFNYRTRSELLALAPVGVVAQELAFENITPTVGFAALASAMTGGAASLDEIMPNVHALGSDNTAPADGDTELGNETVRKLLSSQSSNGGKAFYTAFYDVSEANGTHAEMGLFMDADAGTPDDGTMWDRSLISITKTNTQSLTIDYEDTFTNG